MVVVVQKDQGLLSEHDEEGVAQFYDFGDGEEQRPEGRHAVWVAGVAQGIGQSLGRPVVEEVLNNNKLNLAAQSNNYYFLLFLN